jgi:drug/metabolite transporter (DMT)-like permease
VLARGSRLDWFTFVSLGAMWGSSYLFIKIGVADLAPMTLIALRLGIGFALLLGVWAVSRQPLPRERRMYGHLAVLSVISIVLPFWLIAWAELSVDSALASVINATVPLFVIVIAAAFLADEPITVNRLAGLAIGFTGVVLLTVRGAGGGAGDGAILGELALIASSISYAVGGVYARRTLRGLTPLVPALVQVGFAFVIATVLALLLESGAPSDFTPEAIASVVWLGLIGSGLAYLAWFRLILRWGATRTSLVAYLLPVVGIGLGVAVLGETVDARMLAGTALVIGGIALVNSRHGTRRLAGRSPRHDT